MAAFRWIPLLAVILFSCSAMRTEAAIEMFIGTDNVFNVFNSFRGPAATAAHNDLNAAIFGKQATLHIESFSSGFGISQGAFNAGNSLFFNGLQVRDADSNGNTFVDRVGGLGSQGGSGALRLTEVGGGEPNVAINFEFDTPINYFSAWIGELGSLGFAQFSFLNGGFKPSTSQATPMASIRSATLVS